jgi:hypothetical protein
LVKGGIVFREIGVHGFFDFEEKLVYEFCKEDFLAGCMM